ncbi:MAG: DUF3473 domain-containing protein [Desulfobacterales bacterium]|nr:MAG: DUF3473 domain-containing protein [Desulfobacterales bacterium]
MFADNYILLTIDVEDWFQVENFKPWIDFSSWLAYELRVEQNTHNLLDLFDRRKRDVTTKDDSSQTLHATFFILGWIAEHLPHLIREIHARGHEVASHGYNHHLLNRLGRAGIERELSDSKKRLEDIIGSSVVGFRAPSFGINHDLLKMVEASGYFYDSSYNSFGLHDRYGKLTLNGKDKKGIAHRVSEKFFELPVSNLNLKGAVFPLGGGSYFRLIPFLFFNLGLKKILRDEHACLIYMHPWEIDPEQPRVEEVPAFYKFRHYTNLRRTRPKLEKLIKSLANCRFISCREYLAQSHCHK